MQSKRKVRLQFAGGCCDVLRLLPAGMLVDGEVVAFDADGRPDLRRLLRRHALTDP